MDVIAAWLLMPVIAVAACLGIGLLVERASGARLPGVLLAPLGMGGLVAAGQLTTYWDWSAELTIPLCALLAVAGWVVGWKRRRPDPWAAACAAGVFAVFAAPIVLSGSATFGGYTILGDTSIHFVGADALLEHGRAVADLPPSSYAAAVSGYYGGAGYPSGGPVASGVLAALSAQDVAWVFQPFLALLAALTALALWSLLEPLVAPPALRAGIAFLAAQPALVLAYALQGSVKEIGTVFAVLLVAALVPVYVRDSATAVRRVVPLAVASSAAVGFVGAAVAVWLGPLLGAALVAALYVRGRRGARGVLAQAGAFLLIGAVLCWQTIADLATYVDVAGRVVTLEGGLGNLLRPLNELQVFGVWLTGDYRMPPSSMLTETYLLIGVTAVASGLGLAWIVRRRAWSVLLLIAVSLFAWIYVTSRGSPWADAKAHMIVSPVVVLVAGLGAAGLHAAGRRIEGVALVVLLGCGVLLSNALAYHDVALAPHDRMAELERIGSDLGDRGPTLSPEFEEFAKHFLRDGQPTAPSEAWTSTGGPVPPRPGGTVRFAFGVDLDSLPVDYVQGYRTIVLRRGFMSSRPPAGWRRTSAGDFYEVWERGDAEVVEHLPLGQPRQPSDVPRCRAVRALARNAREAGARLVAAPRPSTPLMVPATLPHPPAWVVDGTDPAVLQPVGPGQVSGRLRAPSAGSYDLWAEGSFGRGIDVFVDGRRVGDARDALNGRWSAEHVARLRLDAGSQEILIKRGGGNLEPGNGGQPRLIGPLALTRADQADEPLVTVDPNDWRSLCGRSLDWIEVVRT